MLRAAIYILLCFLPAILLSQVNTEKMRKSAKVDGYHFSLQWGLGIAGGNSDYVNTDLEGRIDYLDTNVHAFVIGSYGYMEGEKTILSNRSFAHARLVYDINDIFAPELFMQKEFNRLISLSDRNIAGAGIRIHPVSSALVPDSSTKVNLYLGIGTMYEYEEYKKDIPPEKELLRSTNYLNFNIELANKTKLSIITYYQFDTGNPDDYRILSETSLSFDITGFMKFIAEFNYRFDSEPSPGIENFDYKVQNGIIFEF